MTGDDWGSKVEKGAMDSRRDRPTEKLPSDLKGAKESAAGRPG